MKLSEFQALCQKEWDKCRGDIITLWLTEDNYTELYNEALKGGFQNRTELFIRREYTDLGPAHPAFDNVVNPVTKTRVRLRLAKDNVADCFSGKTKQVYSVVLREGDCAGGSP